MKKSSPVPRFLPDVLQAICELKETGGSNTNKIVNYVKSNGSLPKSHSTPRNLTTQVRRALNHATSKGIIQHRAGKFKINKVVFDPYKDCAECRRRKRGKKGRKSRGRRRRGRRHATLGLESESEGPQFISDSESDLPVRQLRRRRRKGGKRRSRRRRGRRSTLEVPKKMSKKDINDTEDRNQELVYPDDYKEGDMINTVQCDNPECLCNVKDGNEEMPNSDFQM